MCWHYRKVTLWCSESCPLFRVSFIQGFLYSGFREVPLYAFSRIFLDACIMSIVYFGTFQ